VVPTPMVSPSETSRDVPTPNVSPRKVPSPAVSIRKSLHKMKEMVKPMKPNVFPRTPEEQVSNSDRDYEEAIRAEKKEWDEKTSRALAKTRDVVDDFKERFSDNPAIAAVADRHLAEMAKAAKSYDAKAWADALDLLKQFMKEAGEL